MRVVSEMTESGHPHCEEKLVMPYNVTVIDSGLEQMEVELLDNTQYNLEWYKGTFHSD